MNSFSFEFTTKAGGKPLSFHFHVHGAASEAAARDTLVKQLEDLAKQAKALSPSKAIVTSQGAAGEPADGEGDAPAPKPKRPSRAKTSAAKTPAPKKGRK